MLDKLEIFDLLFYFADGDFRRGRQDKGEGLIPEDKFWLSRCGTYYLHSCKYYCNWNWINGLYKLDAKSLLLLLLYNLFT